MKFKHLTLSSLFLICTIPLVLSCGEKSLTEVEQIVGLYKAVEFTEPGQHDGGVDILAIGGSLTLRLFDNFEVEGHFKVPNNTNSTFRQTDEKFKGTFSLNADTVRFTNTGIFLDSEYQLFLVIDNQLRTPDRLPGRWGPYVVFKKQ